MQFQSKRVPLPGRGLALDSIDVGEGAPVLFLHGITDSWRSFSTLLPHLPAGMRALAISQRGHGESDRPESGYTLADMADDAAAFLDAHGIARAFIVGHSMGAGAAAIMAQRHSQRVRGLALLGAFADFAGNPAAQEFVAACDELTDPIDPAFARAFQAGTIATQAPPGFLDMAVAESLTLPARVWRAASAGLAHPPLPAALSAIDAPALVLWGSADVYATRADQDAICIRLRRRRFHAFEGLGHALHWEAPEACAGAITRFLACLTVMERASA